MKNEIESSRSVLARLIELVKIQSLISRRFDSQLGVHGLGFGDFIILYHLANSPEGKLRRVDLAEAVGVTASGVTRMLAPMEKIGLVTRETNERDARVSFVVLSPAGRRLFDDSASTMNYFANLFSESDYKQLDKLSVVLNKLK